MAATQFLESSKDFLGYKKENTANAERRTRKKRCQRPPKAAPPPDAHCQKTDLSRVQSAKDFLFSTIATATLSRSFARSLARWALPISFTLLFLVICFPFGGFYLLRFSGAFFCLRGFYLLRFSSAFLFSLLVFHLLCFSGGYFFPPSDFSIFYTSLEYFFSPFTFSSFALHFGISFFALLRFPSFDTSLAHFFRHPGFPSFTLLLSWPFLSTFLDIPSFPVYTFTPLLENFFSSS